MRSATPSAPSTTQDGYETAPGSAERKRRRSGSPIHGGTTMKAISTLLALLLLVGAAAYAAADAPLASVSGRIVSVDAPAMTLVVKVDDKRAGPHDVTFTLDGQSKIVKNGGAVPASDLAAGDAVTVTYRTANDKN